MEIQMKVISFTVVFITLFAILNVLMHISLVLALLIGIFGSIVTYLLLQDKKTSKTRITLFCMWGLLFAILIILSSTIHTGFFICPSKIPLVGENAGNIPLMPFSNSTKLIMSCPFGLFQNYLSTTINYGFTFSMLSLSFKIIGLAFFIWLLIALTLGRSWCGWICPFGGLTEAISRIPSVRAWGIDISGEKMRYLRYGFFFGILLLILASKSIPSYYYCVICPFKGVYHSPEYLDQIFTVASEFATYSLFILLLIGASFAAKKRVWCAILCPLGTLTSIVGSYSLLVTRIGKESCIKCKKCINTCKLGVISEKNANIDLHTSSCSNCGDCMDVCPKECIKYYIRGTDIEVKHLFIPIIIICAIVVAVIFVSVLWRPLIDILSYFI